MSEENRNKIIYDENWQTVSYSEYPVSSQTEEQNTEIIEEKENKKKDNSTKQLLITIQLIICIIIALMAFVIKCLGGDFYNLTREWYYSNLNKSVIFDNKNEFNLEKIFSISTADEV